MSDPSAGFFMTGAIPVLFAGMSYACGAARRRRVSLPVSELRLALFAAGLIAFFLSIEWPFADWAHDTFFAHQIGILIARLIAPVLIVAARPSGLLIAGLPRAVRRHVLKPVLMQPGARRIWRALGHPAVALSLYVAALYGWEWPAMQEAALASGTVALAMHFSLLAAGLLFWSRILDRRPAPHAPTHGWRLMMIWIVMLAQIALGAYLTIKATVLYPAYDATRRIAHVSAIVDERRGGFLIWVPGTLLLLFALIVVIDRWGRHETKMDIKRRRWSPSNSAILLYPTTGAALRAMARVKNRRMAIGLIGFVLLILGATLSSSITGYRLNRRQNLREYRMLRGG